MLSLVQALGTQKWSLPSGPSVRWGRKLTGCQELSWDTGKHAEEGRWWDHGADLTPPIWRGLLEEGLGDWEGRRNSKSQGSEDRGRAACGGEGRGVGSWPGAAVAGGGCFCPP